MRILFVISVVALAALLWASVSIAQHIHRSRRRRRQSFAAADPAIFPRVSSDGTAPKASAVGPASAKPHEESAHHRKAS